MSPSTSYSLAELSALVQVSQRTVRYYIKQGLLPSPGFGRGTRYNQTHLQRLKLILDLKAQHLPLAEIRRRLDSMSDDDISSLGQSSQPLNSAQDYLQNLLGVAPSEVSSSKPIITSTPRHKQYSTWERISFSPDAELHIRRPLSRSDNQKIERIVHFANSLFNKESK